jgi:hypothetical protein
MKMKMKTEIKIRNKRRPGFDFGDGEEKEGV